MQVRRLAQRTDTRHAVPGQLRQRLPAEARAAGAEQHDVGGAVGQPPRLVLDWVQIVMLAGQPQQRQAAIGMARAQDFERRFGAPERRLQRVVGDAVPADVALACAVDGLDDWHEQKLFRNDRNNARAVYSVPLEVRPFGRPATVTSMPPPYRRLATRLASATVTASISAPRRWM